MEGLLDPGTQARLEAAAAGEDLARRLRIGDLETDRFGVLEVEVRHVHPAKPFTSRSGRQGVLRRVTLGDATGEVDLVLWGEETAQAVEGPFLPGRWVRLRGASVKAGYRGGVELHLGGSTIEEVERDASVELVGELVSLGDTRPVGSGPEVRFQADLVLAVDGPGATSTTSATSATREAGATGQVQVALWDDAVRTARAFLPGARIRMTARPHPALEGWFVVEGSPVSPA